MAEDKKEEIKDEIKPVLKDGLKDIFLSQFRQAFEDLVKNVVNAKYLGIAIVVWCVLSVGASIFRRVYKDDSGISLCKRTVPLDTYLAGKLLCPTD